MTKKHGFKIKAEFFLELDKMDFKKQAATYAALAEIQSTGKLPASFLETATVISVSAKAGGYDPDEQASGSTDGDGETGPADTPLTTDPLADGATVVDSMLGLDGNVFQTLKLEDGSEAFRRISADQDTAERKKNKKIPAPKAAETPAE